MVTALTLDLKEYLEIRNEFIISNLKENESNEALKEIERDDKRNKILKKIRDIEERANVFHFFY